MSDTREFDTKPGSEEPTNDLPIWEYPARCIPQMSAPNESMLLCEGEATLTLPDGIVAGRAQAWVRWLPRPRVSVELTVAGELPSPGTLEAPWVGKLEVRTTPPLTVTVKPRGFVLSSGAEGSLTLRLAPTDTTKQSGHSSAEADALCFALLNVAPMSSPNAASGRAIAGVVLESKKWRVVVGQLAEAHSVQRALDESGGYGITHSCSLSRIGGGRIRQEDGLEALHALHYFFSFAQGSWAPPMFAVAFRGSTPVWREWYLRNLDRWEVRPVSWFDSFEAQSLEELFPGFMQRWETDLWHDALRRAIYWYVHSNGAGAGHDGAVILAQAGLELLAWTYVVEERGMLTADSFGRIPAAEQIRLLCRSLDIPIELTDFVSHLREVAKRENWPDAVQALTETRNALIHGNPKMRRRLFQGSGMGNVLWDTWNQSLYLLELVLLRLLGYSGLHAVRIDLPQIHGKVVPVPWAS